MKNNFRACMHIAGKLKYSTRWMPLDPLGWAIMPETYLHYK